MKQDLNNNLMIAVVLNLFVLSMISERLVNFLKLNFQKIYTTKLLPNILKGFLKDMFGNFRDKEHSKKSEKERERGVLNWAIFASLIVAFASKADLFYMIKCGELSTDIDYDKINYVGIVLTALFLSLGSKFWHDLLDVLYFYKNAKQKLNDKNIDSFDNADAVEEFVNLKYSELNTYAIMQYPEYFKENPNFLYILSNNKTNIDKELPKLIVHVKDKINCNIPPIIKIQLPQSKNTISIAVQIVQDSIPVANTMISNGDYAGINNIEMGGTICCALKGNIKKDTYLLTCSHVLNEGKSIGFGNFLPKNQQKDVISIKRNDETQESFIIGKCCYSLRNFQFDIALILLDNADTFKFTPSTISNLPIKLEEKDKLTKYVKMRGFVSNDIKNGIIVDFETSAIPIKYKDTTEKLENLIVVSNKSSIGFGFQNSKPISLPGDSGALIYDEKLQPIGMVIASSDNYTFAIPLPEILEELEMQIL